MAKEKERRTAESALPGKQPIEDRALKMAAQFFGEELLPLLGVQGKVRRIAPTEQVHLEVKDFQQDFNFEMEDGTWRHLEFESDQIGLEDLRRFRAYEAVCSYYYGVEVVTSVLCTSDVKELRATLVQGNSCYRVDLIRMKDENADRWIAALEAAQKKRSLERAELVKLLLVPLMSGEMSQPERICRSVCMLHRERENLSKEDLARMEAMLYAFALKFLTRTEMDRIEEVFGMTILGQMLEERGKKQMLVQMVCKKLKKGKAPEVIADELEEAAALIQEICRVAQEFAPDYDVEQIYQAWQKAVSRA